MDGRIPTGGSRVLAELIDAHGEAILSDFLGYYRLDLRELLFTESPRYLLALAMHLPTDGALSASRRGGTQFRGWDSAMYARAAQVNEQRAGNYLMILANRDPKRSKPKPPEPFPTPDENKSKKPKPGSFAAIAASMMAAQRRKREQARGKSP